MKKLTTLSFILFTSCMNSALAKGVNFTCREADPIPHSGYTATFIPGGAILQISMQSLQSKKVSAIFLNGEWKTDFAAKVRFPAPNTQGDMGGFKKRNFSLNFAVLPNYKETNTKQEYLGGELYINGLETFMLCSLQLRKLFW